MGKLFKIPTDGPAERKCGGHVFGRTMDGMGGETFGITIEPAGSPDSAPFKHYIMKLSEPEVRRLKRALDRHLRVDQ